VEKIIGYTAGVYDLFHVGHLNLFKNAKKHCDYLIVGVNTDELVKQYKNKLPVIPFKDRLEIVNSIKYVDVATEENSLDRLSPALKHGASIVFIGSDWKNSPRWQQNEKLLSEHGIKVIYLDYTTAVSTSNIVNVCKNLCL